MAQIYANSQGIVILDDELRQLEFEDVARKSMVFGYLFCSAWMSRCWTFQEGALAKSWFVQFKDKLFCIDAAFVDIEQYIYQFMESHPQEDPGLAYSCAKEYADFYTELPRLSEIEGRQSFSRHDAPSRSQLLRQVWNHITSRSTTKRDDLITILTIMLEYRPKDLDGIPYAAEKLLSIFNSQAALPISFLYRERETVTSWRQAKCWLPSVIENREVDAKAAEIWRRSEDENFFIFNQSIAFPRERFSSPEFYYSDSELSLSGRLYLDDHSGASGEPKFMSAKLMLSPELKLHKPKLWIIISGREHSQSAYAVSRHVIKHGACLGIRKETNDFIQLFYICPVQCCHIDPATIKVSAAASILYRRAAVEDFDYVLEHGRQTNLTSLFLY